MSRPRSPHYRRFPWEEASFDSHKVIAGLGGNPQDRSHRPRHKPEEHWDCVREDLYPESQRRSPPLRDDRKLGHQRRPDKDEFYQRATPSPHYEGTSFDERRLPPLRNAAGDGDKCREQLWLVRERLPQAPRSHSDHQHREAGRNWSEEQGRGQGKFRDLSPAVRGDDLRGAGRERGRRNAQCPNRDRRREEPHQERSPAFKKQRRETDDTNNHLGSLLYSSDRQLSLDLVNVGRQRLDFLPMLEHSGTYRETATHTGTFAQEIITLVHHVKEHYFRGDDITLNERFSAPQKGGYAEEETMELTLDERFSSNRGFSLNIDSLLDEEEEEEPLFSRLGSVQGLNQQPVRGPGDLRHDLERRRQERLEGVKVTIPGGSMSQRLHGPVSEAAVQYSDDMSPLEDDDGFSSWSEEQSRRPEGKTVSIILVDGDEVASILPLLVRASRMIFSFTWYLCSQMITGLGLCPGFGLLESVWWALSHSGGDSRKPSPKTSISISAKKAQRRGGLFYRQNTGFQRRNNRSGNRFGPVRRQSNNRNINTGPQW
uniref:BCLAF1 and THRAP3 family member 3 isoform X5 n=1 Tax=Solea senegalensis TaxID=28829 RepID=UPI001CD887AC|nr:BCLAF1 and THRAP3 family member 3 isoform X5 [Solea senegalensis]